MNSIEPDAGMILIVIAAVVIPIVAFFLLRGARSKAKPAVVKHSTLPRGHAMVVKRLIDVFLECNELMRTTKTPKVVECRFDRLKDTYEHLAQYSGCFPADHWQHFQKVYTDAEHDRAWLYLKAVLHLSVEKACSSKTKKAKEKWLLEGTQAINNAIRFKFLDQAQIDLIAAEFHAVEAQYYADKVESTTTGCRTKRVKTVAPSTAFEEAPSESGSAAP
ncbi:MAG: hypothetical protein NTV22_17475 [bacterium]|nr:hypothetical protein [bacterium]